MTKRKKYFIMRFSIYPLLKYNTNSLVRNSQFVSALFILKELMAKKDFVEVEGTIEEALPAATFNIKLDSGQVITAYMSGKMRQFKIKLVPGDRVKVELSPYDLKKGRISFRL